MDPERDLEAAAAATPAVSRRKRWIKSALRVALLLVGLGAVIVLVNNVGAAALWQTLREAGIYVPIIVLLNAAWVICEAFALVHILGVRARRVPGKIWVRAVMTQYSTMVVLPVGRAGAEVARATVLAPYVGGPHASAAAARMQGVVLIANFFISMPCALAAVWVSGSTHALTVLLLVNGFATLFGGGALLLALRRVKIGGWLGRRFKKLAQHGPRVDEALQERPRAVYAGVLLAFMARGVQTVEYGVILLAVAGSAGVVASLLSQGIHLVGAGLGDFVPNSVGVMEGAYRVFAPSLGLGDVPEKALAIALLARVSNLSLALGSFLVLQFWRAPDRPATVPESPGLAVEESAPTRLLR